MESPPEQGRLVYCIRVVVCYVPLPHVVAKLYRHTPNASQRLSVHIVSLFVGEVPHFIVDRQVLVLLWGLSPALGFGGRPGGEKVATLLNGVKREYTGMPHTMSHVHFVQLRRMG